jgi:sugar lactone lactonase YvrE
VDAVTKVITTFAGNGQPVILGDNGPATAATLRHPVSIAADGAGNVYINDFFNNRIRWIEPTGVITTVAGGGQPESGDGDGGPATNAHIAAYGRIALDPQGNLYIAETYNYRIRKIAAGSRIISKIAGNETESSSGDGGPALNAGVLPDDLAVDWHGNLYFVENSRKRVRKLNLSTNVVDHVAGGDGSLGGSLRIAAHPGGDLYIADSENGVVRKIEAATGEMTIVAGGGSSYQDNQLATSVRLAPVAVDVDSNGNLYIMEYDAIRKVSAESKLITSIAGARSKPFQLGDNGHALDAFFFYPQAVALDPSGNVFIADSNNGRIRVIRGPLP